MRNFIPQQEKFEKFSDLIDAAATQYTLSFRDACKALKCSRSWAQTYIRPHVANIYVQNGKGTGKANYARLVSLAVNQQNGSSGYSNESVYLDEAAFNQFIFDAIVSCKKRSKQAYKTFFIESKHIEAYYRELLTLYYSLYGERKKEAAEKLLEQIDTLYLKYAKNNFVKDIIHPAIVYQTKRTDADFVDVAVPDVPIIEWKAVHDLMDYGDIEETIYRSLFKEGCIRIEIKLPDKNGEIKDIGKVYYISDPEPIKQITLSENMTKKILSSYTDTEDAKRKLDALIYYDRINIKQSAWIKYNNMLGNTITY